MCSNISIIYISKISSIYYISTPYEFRTIFRERNVKIFLPYFTFFIIPRPYYSLKGYLLQLVFCIKKYAEKQFYLSRTLIFDMFFLIIFSFLYFFINRSTNLGILKKSLNLRILIQNNLAS